MMQPSSERTLKLFDEPLIPDTATLLMQGDGRHRVREYAGSELFVEVRGGKIVGYSATRDGQPIETINVRVEAGETSMRPVDPRCYKCMCWPEGCGCWEIPC